MVSRKITKYIQEYTFSNTQFLPIAMLGPLDMSHQPPGRNMKVMKKKFKNLVKVLVIKTKIKHQHIRKIKWQNNQQFWDKL